MKVVRTYNFSSSSSSRTLVCHVYVPELYPDQPNYAEPRPAVIISYELGEPKSGALCPSRMRVNSRSDFPTSLLIDEVEYFFQTLKQMYQL